jgi:hypothetical protein
MVESIQGFRSLPCTNCAAFVVACYNDASNTTTDAVQVVLGMKLSSKRVVDEINKFGEVDTWVIC